MRLNAFLRRLVSGGLAVLVLVSSLTCMTVTCRVVCAAEARAATGATSADLPACHRAAEDGSSTAPAPASEGCGSGAVCCSTWHQDRDVYRMPAPLLARPSFLDDGPALVPAAPSVRTGADAFALLAETAPPDPPVSLRPTPHASRAPPGA